MEISQSATDPRPITPPDGRQPTFRYCPPDTWFDPSAVTSASVVAFMPDGRLALALLDRGPDLPGGHVDAADQSVEAAVRREAMEEAGLVLGPLALSCVIESDYFGPDNPTYLLGYAARVEELREIPAGFESSGRLILTVDEFLERHSAGDIGGMRLIVESARAALINTMF